MLTGSVDLSGSYQLENVSGVSVVRLLEPCDANVLKSLREAVTPQVGCCIAVDLSRVDFLDSAALGWLMSLYRRVLAVDGRFCVFAVSPQVMTILELTKVHNILPVTADEAAALELLSAPI